MTSTFRDAIAPILPAITSLRHELHRIPETRYAEHKTSERIAAFLEGLGIPYTRGWAGGTGIVADIRGGEGPTVLLRADMDALEIAEETGLPYASEHPGRMHACGHDGHMACLCGAAALLIQHRDRLKGTVRLCFQPAEEVGAGGKKMVDEGALDGVAVAFAQHIWPGLPMGVVGMRAGCAMASADFIRITVRGRGGHGADPASCIDPVLVAAHIITALQSVVSRELNPWEAGVVSITRIVAGETSNITPETALLEGTVRALTPESRAHMLESVDRIATLTAQAQRATAELYVGEIGYPPLRTDPEVTEQARVVLEATLGKDHLRAIPQPYMTAEDFAYYLEAVPGTFLFLGCDAPDAARCPGLHTPTFNFNDAALPVGVATLVALALRFTGSEE